MMDHPLLDGQAGRFAWTETLADRVCYSEGLSSFFAWAYRQGLRPVVVTHPDGRASFPLAFHMHRAEVLWLRKVDEGYRDLRSGTIYPSISDVPDVAEDSGMAAPMTDAASHLWWSFSVSVQHPAEDSTVVGGVVETLWQQFAGSPPAAWGWHEPCLGSWNWQGFTDSARLLMPHGCLVVSGGDHGDAQGVDVFHRNTYGVEEAISGIAIAGPASMDTRDVGAHAVQALQLVAETAPVPSVGVVSMVRGGQQVWFEAPLTLPVMPLAVLIGPRVVRALGADARQFADAHGGVVAGRGRFPSLIMPLTGTGAGVWERLRSLVAEFSVNQLATALHLPLGERQGVV